MAHAEDLAGLALCVPPLPVAEGNAYPPGSDRDRVHGPFHPGGYLGRGLPGDERPEEIVLRGGPGPVGFPLSKPHLVGLVGDRLGGGAQRGGYPLAGPHGAVVLG